MLQPFCDLLTDFLESNQNGVYASKIGALGFFAAGSGFTAGYFLKPDEFVKFMTDHVGAAVGLGIGALVIVALMMYMAYKYSKKRSIMEDGEQNSAHAWTPFFDNDSNYSVLPADSTLSPTLSGVPSATSLN